MSNVSRVDSIWPYGLAQTIPPAHEPVDIATVRAHLRLDTFGEDTLLAVLIQAAREQIETVTRYQLITATYRYDLAFFPAVIQLPRPPLQSVTTLEVLDAAGAYVALEASEYHVHTSVIPGRVYPVTTWPLIGTVSPSAVRITYVAGFGSLSAVPARYKAMILLLVADLYEHRESETEARLAENKTFQRLLQSARLIEV